MKYKSTASIINGIRLAVGICLVSTSFKIQAQVSALQSKNTEVMQKLYVEVVVNGTSVDGLLPITLYGETIIVQPVDLRKINISIPGNSIRPLSEVPGIKYTYDHASQKIELVVDPMLLKTTHISARQIERNVASSGSGLVTNYEIAATGYSGSKAGNKAVNLWTDIRPFTPSGVGSTSGNYTTNGNKYIRYDTSWVSTNQEEMRSFAVGDVTSGSVNWSRPVRIGGFRINSDYSTRPDLITFPTPTFSGSAEVPTTVDILLNNVKTYSANVESGPFVISNAPILVGAGQISLVVKDVMGRDVVTTMPLYVDNKLLKSGLSSYSFDAGFLRKDYGRSSFDYDKNFVMSGVFSQGISDNLTMQAHGEFSGSLRNAGVGADYLIPALGLISGNFSYSHHQGKTGIQYGFGHQYIGRGSSIYSQCQFNSADFRDLAIISGGLLRKRQCSASGSYSLSERINVGSSIVMAKSVSSSITSYIASMTYRINNNTSLVLNGTKSVGNQSQYSVFAGLSMSFESGISSSANIRNTDRGIQSEIGISKAANFDGGIGYTGQLSKSDGAYRQFGRIDYLGKNGNAYLVANKYDSQISTTFGFYGGLISMGDNLFLSRSVYDSFAVVSTNGVPNIPVFAENRLSSVTDENGYALISNLIGYYKNNISIDLSDTEIGNYSEFERMYVVPKARAGSFISFPLRKMNSAIINLVDADGNPLKIGTTAYVGVAEVETIVGYDGQVYVENFDGDIRIKSKIHGKDCLSIPKIKKESAGIMNFGKQICKVEG